MADPRSPVAHVLPGQLEHDDFRKAHPIPDVMPAKAGIHLFSGVVRVAWRWIPAFAGMTP
jgi:hypothetical protein